MEKKQPRTEPVRGEQGFLLIELLAVVIVLAILLGMAISALSIRDRAHRAVAYANVRTAIPTVEAYYSDKAAYTGMTWAALQAIDAGLSPSLEVESVAAQSYCISDSSGNRTFHQQGPGGWIEEGGCP